ncbi:MAG: hypothetical protein R2822_17600 [Spirosomataceae bacterium]
MSSVEGKSPRRPVRAGRFFRKDEIEGYRTNFENTKTERKAEFFSKSIIEQLLSIEGCDGLRIYYGLAPENEAGHIDLQNGKGLQPRLFLVPVTVDRDADGNPTQKNHDQTFFLRVDTTGKDGEDEAGGAGGGIPCPNFCNS